MHFVGLSYGRARRDGEKVQVRRNVLLPPCNELGKADAPADSFGGCQCVVTRTRLRVSSSPRRCASVFRVLLTPTTTRTVPPLRRRRPPRPTSPSTRPIPTTRPP